MAAAPSDWPTRKPIMPCTEVACPQAYEKPANTSRPAMNTGFLPRRSAMRPMGRKSTASPRL